MTRIPMKGDPPSLKQIVAKYGDPIDVLATTYFDCLTEAEERGAAGETQDADEARRMAEECRSEMAKYGFVPEISEGVATAVRPSSARPS